MSVPAIEKWEGLPFLQQGEDTDKIGPIESSSRVQREPHFLPQGYDWSLLDSSSFNEPGYSTI